MAFTFFFRDAETLGAGLAHALPAMAGQRYIHIWDAGCAHGPEPYTLAILLRSQMPESVFRDVRIDATDVDAAFGEQVTRGIFPWGELKRLPPDLFKRHFRATADPESYQVSEELRAKVEFSRHDLLSLVPVRRNLSMIVCKNVLIHFHEEQRVAVVKMFHRALRDDGLLVMERTQKIPRAMTAWFDQPIPGIQVHKRRRTHPDKQVRVDVCRRPSPAEPCNPSPAREDAGSKSFVNG